MKPRYFLLLFIFVFSILGFTKITLADITSGQVLGWPTNEGSGTTVSDSSGNNYTGTLGGTTPPTWVGGKYGNALYFNGSSTVQSNSTVSLSNVFSASAWIYMTSPSIPGATVGVIKNAYNTSFVLGVYNNGTNVESIFTVGGQPQYGVLSVPVNQWVHLVGTYDGTYMRTYMDGVEIVSNDVTGFFTIFPTNNHINLGTYFGVESDTSNFIGKIDDARVYSRALSAGDVTELYNNDGSVPPESIPPVITAISTSTTLFDATITWQTNEPATSTIFYGTTSSYGSASSSETQKTNHSFNLTNLSSSTLYHFKISSADLYGNIATSSDLTFTTATPDFTAPAISSIASTTSTTTATITWTTDDLSDTQVEYGTTATYTASSTLNSSATTTHSIILTGLTNGTVYHYRVLSRNGTNVLGTSTDKTFITITPGPQAPTYFSAKGVAPDQINLVWRLSTDVEGTVTSYKIYRDGVLIDTIDPVDYIYPYEDTGVNYYQDRDVSPSTSYDYHVIAHDSLGYNSPASATVTASTTAGTPELIPEGRRTNWDAGVSVGVIGGIDQYITGRTNIIDVTQAPYNADNSGAVDVSAAIQAAINDAASGDVVYLPAGTYKLAGTLYAQNKSNFTIRGDGPTQTIIESTGGGISLRGVGVEITYPTSTVLSGAYKGSTQLTVADVSSYNVGDIVTINTQNNDNVPIIAPNGGARLRFQMTRITAISSGSNTITISPAVIENVDSASTTITVTPATQMVSNVGLEDFKIDGNETIQLAIALDGVYNTWIKNVDVIGATNYGIRISSSLNCEVRHSSVIFNSVGSNHAGLLSGHMNSCLIEDNQFLNTFPTIEINGSVGNVIAYNYLNGSSNTNHGPYSDYNLFEGNYADEFKSDGYYGGEGNATYFRNFIVGFLVAKRMSRDFNYIGNIATDYSFGQPNIGNGNSIGFALPSQGIYWKDWNPTIGPTIVGTFTKASSTAGTIQLDSSEDAERMYQYMLVLGCTGNATVLSNCFHPATLDWGLGKDDDKFRWTYATSINLTTNTLELTVLYPTGVDLPNSGTVAGIWPRSEGFQELDMDVNLTAIRKANYIDGGISSFGSLANGETLPDSLYRASKPSFFGNLNWPAVDSSTGTSSVADIPAGYRYIYGSDPVDDTTAPNITSIASSTTQSTATITWNTNESSTSTVRYGATASYGSASTSASYTSLHSITLTGLSSNTTYHFQVSSSDPSGNLATSSDIVFRTTAIGGGDVTPPIIMSVASSTSLTSAIITWSTNEAASSTVLYGTTTSYGSASTTLSLVTNHSIVINSLTQSTAYHFRVESADAAGNMSTSSDYTFTTQAPDAVPPTITPIGSSAQSTSASITWSTNEAATSQIEYGTTTSYTASSTFDTSLVTSHTVGLTGLLPSTLYHYHILSKDAQNNLSTSSDLTLTTSASTADSNPPTSTGGGGGSTGGGGSGGATIIYSNTSDTGCSTGNIFSTTTGKKCEASTSINGCLSGHTFSIITGARCPLGTNQVGSKFSFIRDLTLNSNGEDVRELQLFLNSNGFIVSSTGIGSPGLESNFFGTKTQQALARFQKANGIVPASGYFGKVTKTFIAGTFPTSLQILTPIAAAPILSSVNLSLGSTGVNVTNLQNYLIKLNYLPAGSNNGVFDGNTHTALIKFQANNIMKILAFQTDPPSFKYGEVGEVMRKFMETLQ